MSKILFLCKNEAPNGSGNWTTVSRIKRHVEGTGYNCSIVNTRAVNDDFWIINKNIKGVLAIHALHCSQSLNKCPYPIILIFGGTDLNEYAKNDTYLKEMTKVVEKAKFLITFGPTMTLTAKELWPQLNPECLKEIPQAVEINPSSIGSFDLKNYMKTTKGVTANKIFLLVAGIRPVKDPLYLVNDFAIFHNENPNCYLVIIGNTTNTNKEFYNIVLTEINKLKGVYLLPEMSRENILACMTQSFALVNSSLSEGMSAAILEANSLKLPVIAREIAGNRDLIEHGVTGLLYKTSQEFLTQAQLLMEDSELLNLITKNAKIKVETIHSLKQEATSYHDILSIL